MAEQHQKALKAQLAKVPITGANGIEFYKFLFTNAPDLRVFFKGAENYTAEDVAKSERFEKQGIRLLTSIHVSTELLTNEPVFSAYVYEIGPLKHKQFKVPFATIQLFFNAAFVPFMEHMTGTKCTAEEQAAWAYLHQQWFSHWEKTAKEHNIKIDF